MARHFEDDLLNFFHNWNIYPCSEKSPLSLSSFFLHSLSAANGFPEEIFSCIYCGGLLCPKVFTSTICFLQSPSSLLTSLMQLWQK